jgi:hypothetical protein
MVERLVSEDIEGRFKIGEMVGAEEEDGAQQGQDEGGRDEFEGHRTHCADGDAVSRGCGEGRVRR